MFNQLADGMEIKGKVPWSHPAQFWRESKIRFREKPDFPPAYHGIFSIPDKDFDAFAAWYLAFAEKRELLGGTNHLLYICRKK